MSKRPRPKGARKRDPEPSLTVLVGAAMTEARRERDFQIAMERAHALFGATASDLKGIERLTFDPDALAAAQWQGAAAQRKGADTNAERARIRKDFWRACAGYYLDGYRRTLDELARMTISFCKDNAEKMKRHPEFRYALRPDGKPFKKTTIIAALKGIKRAERGKKGKTS